jgi:purine nucleosidase
VFRFRTIAIALVIAIVAVFAVAQWGQWQTGRVALDPLKLTPGGPASAPPGRIWIDTDAACGATTRTDPDDCLAILWLVGRGADVKGISTSFGNAPGDVVADRTAALVTQMARDGMQVPHVLRGHGAPARPGAPKPPGVAALQAALEVGPLTILALGPLTNVAAALEGRNDLQRNVTRLVAVMGHRPGHLFHPTEGKGSGAFFGHGPIFRDLNVSVDPDAVGTVLALPVPITLIPYDAARKTLITGADLDDLARKGAASAWVARSAQPWLAFWKDEVGLPGFYPFDWIAAAYLADPGLFDCAAVTPRMTQEWTFWIVPHPSLVVDVFTATGDPSESTVHYCPKASALLHDVLVTR